MKKIITLVTALILILLVASFVFNKKTAEAPIKEDPSEDADKVSSFEECAESGNPVMESYPRKCSHNGKTFIEDVGNLIDKIDLITLNSPLPNTEISSPLKITGQARGYWFFEATFPVILTDWDGKIIAEGFATAKDDWMTENFVEFESEISFEKPVYGERGFLILKKSNASGLPEHDDALEIPILFK